jgi:hypothetical protein
MGGSPQTAPDPPTSLVSSWSESHKPAWCQGTTSQLAEKCDALKGHEFTRAAKPIKSTRASAPEGCFPTHYRTSGFFSSLFSRAEMEGTNAQSKIFIQE